MERLKSFFRKPSIFSQILSYFLAIFFLIFLCISYYAYKENTKSFIRLSKELIQKTSNRSIKNSMTFLEESKGVAQLGRNFILEDKDISLNNKRLVNYMIDSLNSYEHLNSVYVGTENGEFIQVRQVDRGTHYRTKYRQQIPYNVKYALRRIQRKDDKAQEVWFYIDEDRNVIDKEFIKGSSYDPRDRGWYQSAKKSYEFKWSDIYIFNTNKEPGITAAQPLFKNQKVIGVFAVDIEMGQIGKFLNLSKLNKQDVSLIFNRKGEVISHSDQDKTILAHNNKIRMMLVNDLNDARVTTLFNDFIHKQNSHNNFYFKGIEYISFIMPFPKGLEKEWFYGVAIPLNVFVGELKDTQWTILLMSILLICGSIFLIAALARKISNPIEKLAQDAESIQKFDLKVDENTKPSAIREIGALQASLASARQNIGMFTHFVPKNLVKKMVQRNKPLKIGGMEKKLTLFFSDIADFTTISEKYSPDLLATHLSEYFEELTGILTKNDATIDKYIGDAIMAFWGAPTPDKNHYVKACRSALYITYHLHHLNKKWAEEKKNPLNTRIGLHYGDVIVGNIGSSDRMNYTVIGDNVNLAARLEGLNKLYDTNILISEDLYDVVKKHMITRVVDMVAVKGKEKSVKIYELLGEKKGDPILIPDQNTIDFANDFNKAFDFYINRNWKESLDIFKDLKHRFGDRKDINLYIKRCQTLLKFPPDKDWNGVFKLNEK